jgi:hypothetical protein
MAYKRTTFSTNDLFIERFWVFGHRFGEVPALCGAEPECERKAGISVKGLASRERLSASDVEEAAFKETDERQMIAAEGRDVRDSSDRPPSPPHSTVWLPQPSHRSPSLRQTVANPCKTPPTANFRYPQLLNLPQHQGPENSAVPKIRKEALTS